MEVVKQLCKAVLDRDYGDIRQYAYEVGKKASVEESILLVVEKNSEYFQSLVEFGVEYLKELDYNFECECEKLNLFFEPLNDKWYVGYINEHDRKCYLCTSTFHSEYNAYKYVVTEFKWLS